MVQDVSQGRAEDTHGGLCQYRVDTAQVQLEPLEVDAACRGGHRLLPFSSSLAYGPN